MESKEIQRQIDQLMHEQNNQPIPEFEGYAPSEMQYILHYTFEPNSPISLQKLTDNEYKEIPMLNQIKYFLELIKKTKKSNSLPKGFYLPKW